MLIAGFQPVSLLDYPGVVCSIVFTQGCPFRCAYCHNPELIPAQAADANTLLNEHTVIERLQRRKNIVVGVCVTGGEPTAQPDLPEFLKKLKALGLLVKLDTNGMHPRMLARVLADRTVDFIAMDIKHAWERYPEVTGVKQKNVISNCQETFHLIQNSSVNHEFRTTVYPAWHAAEDLYAIAGQLKLGERYALQAVRYDKTLDPTLPKKPPLDLATIAERIRAERPDLNVLVRT